MSANDEDPRRRVAARQAMYLSGVDSTWNAIDRVLDDLPAAVREFAHARCVFVSVGGAARGQCVPMWPITDLCRGYLILLDDRATDLDDVIVEEIAHAYDLDRNPGELSAAEREDRAHDLVRAWGFTVPGADS